MFTQEVLAVEWCVRTKNMRIEETWEYFDKLISFYSKSLKNHCNKNKMKTKGKEVLLLTYQKVCVFISVITHENHELQTSSSSCRTVG